MTLVTGSTGFVGRHLVEKLLAKGERVRCLVRPSTNLSRLPAGVETAPASLENGQGVERAVEDVEAVIHVAGVTAALTPAGYFTGNAGATEILAQALRGRPIRVVLISSLAAVGPSPDSTALTEEAEPRPVSTYGRSKLRGEQIVRALLPDAVILRPPVVYGPRDRLVLQILKAVANGFVLEIAGGERWFSSIYVEDLAEGICAAASAPQAAGRDYFLSHRKAATWREFGATAAQIMHRRPRTLRLPMAAAQCVGFFGEMWSRISRNPAIISREKVAEASYRFWVCNPARFAADLGFEAPTPLAIGLAKTLAWYKEAGWLKY